MRKNKFRAWDRWNEEMIYQHDMNYPLENKEYLFSLNEEYVELLRYDEDYSAYVKYDVDIMQYTGVNDLNNNEIYEGDIVKRIDLTPVANMFGKSEIGVVEFDNGSFLLKVKDGAYSMNSRSILNMCSYEVIGNIYENKDMLGE